MWVRLYEAKLEVAESVSLPAFMPFGAMLCELWDALRTPMPEAHCLSSLVNETFKGTRRLLYESLIVLASVYYRTMYLRLRINAYACETCFDTNHAVLLISIVAAYFYIMLTRSIAFTSTLFTNREITQ